MICAERSNYGMKFFAFFDLTHIRHMIRDFKMEYWILKIISKVGTLMHKISSIFFCKVHIRHIKQHFQNKAFLKIQVSYVERKVSTFNAKCRRSGLVSLSALWAWLSNVCRHHTALLARLSSCSNIRLRQRRLF